MAAGAPHDAAPAARAADGEAVCGVPAEAVGVSAWARTVDRATAGADAGDGVKRPPSAVVSVRVPQTILVALDKACAREDRTRSNWIMRLVRSELGSAAQRRSGGDPHATAREHVGLAERLPRSGVGFERLSQSYRLTLRGRTMVTDRIGPSPVVIPESLRDALAVTCAARGISPEAYVAALLVKALGAPDSTTATST